MAYQAWSVTFGEQPSASKWNILGTNDASFNDGTGIDAKKIITRHLGLEYALVSASADTTVSTNTNITGATVTFTPAVASYALIWMFGRGLANGGTIDLILNVDTVNVPPISRIQNAGADNMIGTLGNFQKITLAASSHTIKLVGTKTGTGATVYGASGETGFFYLLIPQ